MSANNCTEGGEIAHCLNANDQRKVFGANQTRTMVGEFVGSYDFYNHNEREDGIRGTLGTKSPNVATGGTFGVMLKVEGAADGEISDR